MNVPRNPVDMIPADMIDRIGRDDPILVECGCHDGRDTEKFLAAFPKCRLFCFEPDPRPIERHDPPGFVDRIGQDPRITLIRAAVGDRDETRIMYRSSGTPPGPNPETDDYDHSGGLFRPTGHLRYSPWVTFPDSHQMVVPVVRLDTWLLCYPEIRQRGIDFLWADVQGAERALIFGAERTLAVAKWFYTEFYDEPMYEGQPGLDEIGKLLSGHECDSLWGTTNALFCRQKESP